MHKVVTITGDFSYQLDKSIKTLNLPEIQELIISKLKITQQESEEICL